MTSLARLVAGSFIAGAAVLSAVAPIALADPPDIPEPGSESAGQTVQDLQNQGYQVQLNWVNGSPNAPLSQCSVTDIDTAGSAGSQPLAYVSVDCPK